MKNIIGIALAVVLLSACSNNGAKINKNQSTNNVNNKVEDIQNNVTNDRENEKVNSNANKNVNEQNTINEIKISVNKEDAFKKYKELHPNTNVNEFAFSNDFEKNFAKYEIEAYDQDQEYEVEINALDGSVIKDKSKKDNVSSTTEIVADMLSGIDDLVKKSIAQAGEDYLLKDYSLSFDDGISKFEVELENPQGKEAEFTYNFESGELLEKQISK